MSASQTSTMTAAPPAAAGEFGSSGSIETTDVDQARVEVANIFCPHRLTPGTAEPLKLSLRSRRLGDVGLVHLDYGTPVQIEPGDLETFYLVQLPLAGQAQIDQGHEQITSSRKMASVLSPGAKVTMKWGSKNPQSIVYVGREAMERHLRKLLGRPMDAPLRFALGMRMADPAVQAWHRTTTYVRDEIAHQSPFLADTRFGMHLQDMLIGQLLLAQPHNYSQQLRQGAGVGSRTVRRACELIRGHHAEALSVADIAEAVGVSIRSLQEGFRRELELSPTTYLRNVRLDAAHESLQSADPASGSVTSVALAHGFAHLGRFSVEYRQRFGQSPSQTLTA